MTTTLATCRYCGTVCADDDTDTAVQLLADHQWRAHPEAACGCGHVRAEHLGTELFSGACRRCGCTAFHARPRLDDAVAPSLTPAALSRRLDDIGGLISAACVSHVWSVVLTIDGVPVARRQHADLLAALAAVVVEVEELRAAHQG